MISRRTFVVSLTGSFLPRRSLLIFAPVVMSPVRWPGRSSARSYRRAMVSGVPGPPTAAV